MNNVTLTTVMVTSIKHHTSLVEINVILNVCIVMLYNMI